MSTENTDLKDVKLEDKAEEKVEEKVEEVKKAKKEMNLAEAIVDYIGLEKQDIVLSPKMKLMMEKLPAVDPKYIKNIETFYDKIVEDKEINVKDVPMLAAIMQELFLLYDSLRMKVSSSEVGSTVKVLVHILISYKLEESDVLSKEQKESILTLLDGLVGVCSEMIELKDTAKKLRSWFSWFICKSM